MSFINIASIEAAINAWRNRNPSPDEVLLCPQARALADLYGQMIWDGKKEIAATVLSADQAAALDTAFSVQRA